MEHREQCVKHHSEVAIGWGRDRLGSWRETMGMETDTPTTRDTPHTTHKCYPHTPHPTHCTTPPPPLKSEHCSALREREGPLKAKRCSAQVRTMFKEFEHRRLTPEKYTHCFFFPSLGSRQGRLGQSERAEPNENPTVLQPPHPPISLRKWNRLGSTTNQPGIIFIISVFILKTPLNLKKRLKNP